MQTCEESNGAIGVPWQKPGERSPRHRSPFVHLAFLPVLNQLDQEMVVKFHRVLLPALT